MTDADRHARAADLFLHLVEKEEQVGREVLHRVPEADLRAATEALLRGHALTNGPLDSGPVSFLLFLWATIPLEEDSPSP